MARGLVLVVEDEPAIAELVRLYLERDGFSVRCQSDGATGLAAIRRDRPVAVVLERSPFPGDTATGYADGTPVR